MTISLFFWDPLGSSEDVEKVNERWMQKIDREVNTNILPPTPALKAFIDEIIKCLKSGDPVAQQMLDGYYHEGESRFDTGGFDEEEGATQGQILQLVMNTHGDGDRIYNWLIETASSLGIKYYDPM